MIVPINQILTAALECARRGWHVFPAPPGEKKSYKSAAYSGGRKWGATSDAEEIRRDLRIWPNANVGVVTGPASGLFVVEADTPKGHGVDGVAELNFLQAAHGTLSDTLMAESPSGSLHYYLKWIDGVKNSSGKIAPGVDVRGDGGMVIAPPSVRSDGAYRWLNDNRIADAPRWLLEKLCDEPRPLPGDTAQLARPWSAPSRVGPALPIKLRGANSSSSKKKDNKPPLLLPFEIGSSQQSPSLTILTLQHWRWTGGGAKRATPTCRCAMPSVSCWRRGRANVIGFSTRSASRLRGWLREAGFRSR